MTCSGAKGNARFIPFKITKQTQTADTYLNFFLNSVYTYF